jgi:tRNA U34 5-carboxymethylaminomethyl modifying enzyme MnmG/GidA
MKSHRWGSAPLKKEVSLQEILKRPETHFWHVFAFDRDLENLPKEVWEQVEIQVKYDGYIKAGPGAEKEGCRGWGYGGNWDGRPAKSFRRGR